MARPLRLPRDAFSLLPGSATPRSRSLTGCQVEAGYWLAAEDEAVDELLAAKSPQGLQMARHRLNLANDRRVAAEARLGRAECEAAGLPWLAVAGGERV